MTNQKASGQRSKSAIILTWILFMIWFYHSRANLQARISYPLSYKPGWAVANFFVPVVSLYRPYQTMKELYVDTRDLLVKNGLAEKTILSTHHLGWWWALWLITGLTANIILKACFQEFATIDQIISLTVTQIIDAALNILCALLTIIVVRNYSRVESMLGEIEVKTASGSE